MARQEREQRARVPLALPVPALGAHVEHGPLFRFGTRRSPPGPARSLFRFRNEIRTLISFRHAALASGPGTKLISFPKRNKDPYFVSEGNRDAYFASAEE